MGWMRIYPSKNETYDDLPDWAKEQNALADEADPASDKSKAGQECIQHDQARRNSEQR